MKICNFVKEAKTKEHNFMASITNSILDQIKPADQPESQSTFVQLTILPMDHCDHDHLPSVSLFATFKPFGLFDGN